jgi:hypothetical protein
MLDPCNYGGRGHYVSNPEPVRKQKYISNSRKNFKKRIWEKLPKTAKTANLPLLSFIP